MYAEEIHLSGFTSLMAKDNIMKIFLFDEEFIFLYIDCFFPLFLAGLKLDSLPFIFIPCSLIVCNRKYLIPMFWLHLGISLFFRGSVLNGL